MTEKFKTAILLKNIGYNGFCSEYFRSIEGGSYEFISKTIHREDGTLTPYFRVRDDHNSYEDRVAYPNIIDFSFWLQIAHGLKLFFEPVKNPEGLTEYRASVYNERAILFEVTDSDFDVMYLDIAKQLHTYIQAEYMLRRQAILN